ncbi:alpha/beta hydrolase [Fibrella forsythiae]|uniref:Alpha/beta hydrolase n=1 Tax=Fibrella forsythiae TaxID=2817061 RepID=A0ABS3JQL5_9BACT|nr:alpha/beta hydrolase [Fibrella forsythiae]MBO0952283.1 alpha/beta hydrolase [Fibrella forsythiae]
MKRILLVLAGLLVLLAVVYGFGPRPQFAHLPIKTAPLPADLATLERTIAESEKGAGLKPDNEARIIWADSNRKAKTPVSMVYIPGFGASWAEGDPVHKRLAAHFGCNLYLARPEEHGLTSPDALKKLTPESYAASAERALAIGKALGDRVVVIGTSAGGMLTLYLAERHPELAGVVLYSPCIATANPALKLATKPWGVQIMRQVLQGDHVNVTHYKPDRARYWLTQYHINGLVVLQAMMDEYMTPAELARVKQPLFLGYYYKDDDHQDKVVSVAAMLAMYDQLGTLPDRKEKVAFPNAGEHVIASHFTSGDLNGVYRASERFLTNVVKLKPVLGTLASK